MIADSDLNLPEVVAEVTAAFETYESKLRSNDVAALNDFFLPGARTVRYGVADAQYGDVALHAWRRSAPPVHPGRRIMRSVVFGLGRDSASVAVEFADPGSSRIGRQTQHWVRSERGWKIALAHVSLAGPDLAAD
ncbi:MAG TPA: AtzH-like domain-containing protein [Steroidobacteraceae bacterium]|nr:AtzH-like domain-containing protein [Steroidobacteraceae bacterium]